jgi:hypothetical protein
MDEPEDDLTLVYMWAYKQAEKKYKGRIEQLEAALRKIANNNEVKAGTDAEMYKRWRKVATDGIDVARAALGEKKDD